MGNEIRLDSSRESDSDQVEDSGDLPHTDSDISVGAIYGNEVAIAGGILAWLVASFQRKCYLSRVCSVLCSIGLFCLSLEVTLLLLLCRTFWCSVSTQG